MERSFTEIVRRHEAWRTTFEWDGDEGVQIVQPAPAHIKIPFVDLRAHPQAEQEALRLATEDARQPFDLAQRSDVSASTCSVARRGASPLHHVASHHLRWRLALSRPLAGASRLSTKRSRITKSPTLPELPIQYPDYAIWQRDSIKEIPPDQLSYWKTVLDDLPVLELKTDHPRPPAQTYAGAMELFEISPATTAALKALSQEQGVTLFMTMTAAFMALLQSNTNQDDIVIGGITSGRNHEETGRLLGCFLNTIPIRCAFSKDVPFTELLARTRKATLGALSHDEVPFEMLVQKFARNRDPSRAPLVQALIVVEPPLESLPTGWDFTHMDVETGTAKFDLQLGLDDRADGFRGRFIYNTDLFERETIDLLRSRWLELLDRIVAAPTQRVGDLTGTATRDAIKLEMPPAVWNETRTNYPRDAAIHEVFEQQVRRTPTAIAVVFENTQLSYETLNRRANQLARRLRKLGVDRDVPVGVWMQRSPEMVIALLAILKAGGAYVPLDPSYPTERLAMMIDDTQMPIILADTNVGSGELRAAARAHNCCSWMRKISPMKPIPILRPTCSQKIWLTSCTRRARPARQRA